MPGLWRSHRVSLDQKRDMYLVCTCNMAKDIVYTYNLVKAQKQPIIITYLIQNHSITAKMNNRYGVQRWESVMK